MTSISAANGQNQNNPYLYNQSSVTRTKVEVSASSIQNKADSFESQIKDRINNASDPKAAYRIVSRFQQLQAKIGPETVATPNQNAQATATPPFLQGPSSLNTLQEARTNTPPAQPVPSAEAEAPSDSAAPFTFDDLLAAREMFGARTGDANFNERYDANQDGVINFSDLVTMLSNLETEAPAE